MSTSDYKQQEGAEPSISSLSLSPSNDLSNTRLSGTRNQSKKTAVVDSWEDEAAQFSQSAEDSDSDRSVTARDGSSIPNAPPPTPISPVAHKRASWDRVSSTPSSPPDRSNAAHHTPTAPYSALQTSRPEKSTAAAGRMIAGALGVRTPAKSEESKAYERAMRDKEIKRIQKEREAKAFDEEQKKIAKTRIWED